MESASANTRSTAASDGAEDATSLLYFAQVGKVFLFLQKKPSRVRGVRWSVKSCARATYAGNSWTSVTRTSAVRKRRCKGFKLVTAEITFGFHSSHASYTCTVLPSLTPGPYIPFRYSIPGLM